MVTRRGPGSPEGSRRRLALADWVAEEGDADTANPVGSPSTGDTVEVVEESDTGAEQDRGDVDVDLVEQAGVQVLRDGVGTVAPTDFPAAAASAWLTALSMPSVTRWTVEPGRAHPAGTRE